MREMERKKGRKRERKKEREEKEKEQTNPDNKTFMPISILVKKKLSPGHPKHFDDHCLREFFPIFLELIFCNF